MAASAFIKALTEPSADPVELKEEPVLGEPVEDTRADALTALYADRPTLFLPDRSAYGRLAEYIGYKMEDPTRTYAQIGELMQLAPGTVRGLVYRAAKAGWLKFDNPMERFENEIVPKVVDNIAYYIDKKDKTMTIEAAKGSGIFKSHQSVRNEADVPQTVLALKVEIMDSTPKVLTGHVVGTPKTENK